MYVREWHGANESYYVWAALANATFVADGKRQGNSSGMRSASAKQVSI